MSASTDVPHLPDSYHDMLPVYARAREYQKAGDMERYSTTMAEWQQWTQRLQVYVQYPADYVPVPGRLGVGSGLGFNDLGGAYPADWFL